MEQPIPFSPRFVDRDEFARKFLRILAGLTDAELSSFLRDTRKENSGTEIERLMLELIEGHIALRQLR